MKLAPSIRFTSIASAFGCALTLAVAGTAHATPGFDNAAASAPLTRSEVKEALKMSRASNTMNVGGEVGDSTEVLQARDTFNELQAEVLTAQAQQQAELLAAQRADEKAEIAQIFAPENVLLVAKQSGQPVQILLFVDEAPQASTTRMAPVEID